MRIIIVPNACDCCGEKCLAWWGMVHGQSALSDNCCWYCDLLSSLSSVPMHCPDKKLDKASFVLRDNTKTIPSNCELFWPRGLSYYCQSPALLILWNKLEVVCRSPLSFAGLPCVHVCMCVRVCTRVHLNLQVVCKVQTKCKGLCYVLHLSSYLSIILSVR